MTILWNKNLKELVWEVVSDKSSMTRVVLVKTVKVHPLYKKRFIVKKKFFVHDEQNQSKIGNTVRVRECKPVSKLKKWTLIQVVS